MAMAVAIYIPFRRHRAVTIGRHQPTPSRWISSAVTTGTATDPIPAAGRPPAGGAPCTSRDEYGTPADDEAPCAFCSTLRALLHCAQHRARLCLPCDIRVHAAAPAHERAPLCDACHAAPAAVHCAGHQACLCAPCARRAGCKAERHATRPARAYTGIPEPAELARILTGDTTPPPLPEPDTWVPDLINIELLPDLPSTSTWRDGNVSTELLSGSLIETGGSFEPTGDGDELFMQQDWPNLGDAGLDDFNFITQDSNLTNSFNSIGHKEAYQFSSVPTTASTSSNVGSSSSELLPRGNTFYTSGMLPRDEFPSRHLGFEVKPISSPTTGVYQDQDAALQASSAPLEQPSSQDMEARTKQREKRQEAKQRYKDKKKNRRFGKQIMYVSRKVRADTRNRVKGRFAKAPGGSGHGDDDQPTQHGDDDEPTNS